MDKKDGGNFNMKAILGNLDFSCIKSEITLPNWVSTTKVDLDSPDMADIIDFQSYKEKRILEEEKNASNVIKVDFLKKERIS